jgi:exopolysaccharide production protein ExoZ
VNDSRKIHSLQALRAVAASFVVIDHTLLELTNNSPRNYLTQIGYTLGEVGVYSFFVLSGFIMVYVSWSSFGGSRASAKFIWRRIIRIVPIYWIGTLAALGFHKISDTHGGQDSWGELLYSVAFIPYRGNDGTWSPILPQGWTLNYEMMFYVIFALGLCIPRKFGLPTICAVLLTLVVIGGYSPSEVVIYLASPIVIWFLLGIALAIIWKHGKLSEPTWIGKSAERLEPIGDASYSLYLVHGFVLTMLLRLWVGTVGPPSLWLVPVSLVVAIAAGRLIYVVIERPLLGLLSGKNSIKDLWITKSANPAVRGISDY